MNPKLSKAGLLVGLVLVAVAATSVAAFAGAFSAGSNRSVHPFASSRTQALHSWSSMRAGSPPASVISMLEQRAMLAATSNGEQSPTNMHVYATTNAAAANADDPGATPATDQPVYLVVMHGNFVAYDMPVPYGVAAPRGSVLTVGFDAATGDETQFSVTNHEPNPAALGAATALG